MLIGISGKKQAGKDSVFKHIKQWGKNYIWQSGPIPGRVTPLTNTIQVVQHSFADLLKRNVCMDIFGLTYEQCYGTDEDKNTLTELKWEDVRQVLSQAGTAVCKKIVETNGRSKLWTVKLSGPMTAREVLQIVGTDLFRKICPDIWVKASLRNVSKVPNTVNIFTDARFPNEVIGIKEKGGKVIRLTRNPLNDQHSSETALDQNVFDWSNFDAVIDNENLSIEEQGEACLNLILGWHAEAK